MAGVSNAPSNNGDYRVSKDKGASLAQNSSSEKNKNSNKKSKLDKKDKAAKKGSSDYRVSPVKSVPELDGNMAILALGLTFATAGLMREKRRLS